ncbi:hypothetical protein CPC08DRAFT_60779 [Agrocybe pediades]|nr:hypothetical protein CPC08DRAFT_60779 [Agrocybe pediades]
MSTTSQDKMAELLPLIIFFAFVFAALLFWCFISSCLGMPLRRSLSNLWEYSLLGANAQRPGPGMRGRVPYREDDMWEMQTRGRH